MDGQYPFVERAVPANGADLVLPADSQPAHSPDAMPPRSVDDIRHRCEMLRERAVNARAARQVLPEAVELADRYPEMLEARLVRAQVRELTRVNDGMLEEWQQLHAHFPDCDIALRLLIRWLFRSHRTDEARRVIEAHFGGRPQSYEARMFEAELFIELRDFERSDQRFQQIVADFPNKPSARATFAKRLAARGQTLAAHAVLRPVAERLSGEGAKLFARIDTAVAALRETITFEELQRSDFRVVALREAIGAFRHRALSPTVPGELNGVALITGTLGAGGSERQMTRLATELELARRDGTMIDGVSISGRVEVVVKSLYSKQGDDFFLDALRESGVPTSQMLDMRPVAVADHGIADERLRALCPVLPMNAIFGIERLVPYFRERTPECAFIWQDGAVLVAALAALIAGVPRVVLNLRGLPPSIRTNLLCPEYQDMYAALAEVPGVTFVSNSRAAAAAYCDWIGLEPNRFEVIPNGVPAQSKAAPDAERRLWDEFSKDTSDSTETIGGVFRFDHNKRPLMWIDFAQQYLERRPGARFVMVGSGNQLPVARQRIEMLGLADRVLLVGRSQHVGFWLNRFDALCLLSRYEGLPNVLIEAQMAGVPVVSTPAGGAVEAFADGLTGIALSCAESPNFEEFFAAITRILHDRDGPARMQQTVIEWACNRFSVEAMVGRTVSVLTQHKARPATITELDASLVT